MHALSVHPFGATGSDPTHDLLVDAHDFFDRLSEHKMKQIVVTRDEQAFEAEPNDSRAADEVPRLEQHFDEYVIRMTFEMLGVVVDASLL